MFDNGQKQSSTLSCHSSYCQLEISPESCMKYSLQTQSVLILVIFGVYGELPQSTIYKRAMKLKASINYLPVCFLFYDSLVSNE